jgi:hypothetical protein
MSKCFSDILTEIFVVDLSLCTQISEYYLETMIAPLQILTG